jgi:hypothetical protein
VNNNAHSQREVNGAHSLLSQAGDLLDEAHALSYALVMVLAHTPRAELSREEIDALCQLAYELQNKLTKTHEVFQEAARRDQATPHNPLAVGAQPGRAQTEGGVSRQPPTLERGSSSSST